MIGLTLGVYAALALRDLVYGEGTILWGVLWKAETDWLPFLTLVTVLVFWQAGLYAERERRAGFGRVVGSLALIGVITLIFALGTGPPVLDVRPGPDGDRTRGNLHRPAARELRHPHPRRPQAGRRSPTGDPGRRRGELDATPQDARAGPRRDRLRLRRRGWASSDPRRDGLRILGRLEALPAVLARTRGQRADRDRLGLQRPRARGHRRARAPRGVKVRVAPRASELLIERRGEYVPGEGVPLFELRPPVFVGHRLGGQAYVRPRRVGRRRRPRPAVLAS